MVEFLPSKQAVAGSSPVSRSTLYTVSVQARLEAVGDNQTVIGESKETVFVMCKKAYSDILPRHVGDILPRPHATFCLQLFLTTSRHPVKQSHVCSHRRSERMGYEHTLSKPT